MTRIRRIFLVIILCTLTSALPGLHKALIVGPLSSFLLMSWDDFKVTQINKKTGERI